jgi:tRNA threonylcarbamoyl adenosine modification protein (Sua5/YciO/YrdC/YwlC family)
MPPVVIDLRKAEDVRDVVHQAVQALVEGKLVAFPTETVYGVGASACHSGAVAHLMAAKERPQGVPFALAIKSAQEAADYFPEMSSLARRLARRCWPGPVTLVLDDAHEQGLARQLPESVQRVICPNGTLGLRVAAGGTLLEVLQMLAGPIVLTSANRSGSPDAVTATQVVEAMGDDVALVLDDGPCRYGQPSSVVRVYPDHLEVLREGVVAESTLRRLTSVLVLLVCTGNTCRSPMAELLMRRELARRLNCDEQNLEEHGVLVQSAGIAAAMGSPPSTEAVRVMEELGMDLRGHESRTLTEQLVRHADLILTMTSGHFDAIVAHWPEAADRTHLILEDSTDVGDPIGQSIDVYRQCAEQIRQGTAQQVERLSEELKSVQST